MATRQGKRAEARYHFRCALRLDPLNTEVLLWLGFLAGGGRPSLEYLVRVLDADPSNSRARSAIRWARSHTGLALAVAPARAKRMRAVTGYAQIAVVICIVLSLGLGAGVAAAMALDIPEPLPTRALVLVVSRATPEATATVAVATRPMEVEKPTSTVAANPPGGKSPSSSPVSLLTRVRATRLSVLSTTPTDQIRDSGRHTSRPIPSPEPSADLTADDKPLPAAIPATARADSKPLTATPFPTARIGDSFRWIDVDLTQQLLVAYEGETAVRSVVVSTGLPRTPTVTGRFKIYVKYRAADMSGPGYYLAKVPYIMYFYRGYGLHGTYWHSNFGQPMSHGCVNLPTSEAEWLFQWASVGIPVNIHY